MDFITGLPTSSRGNESIWVIVDRLSKVAHFLPVRTTYQSSKLAELYIASDAARPTVVTTSRSPTYAKSSWTPKVSPFLYASSLPTLLNGILLHTSSYGHDRFTLISTEAREEARSIKPAKTMAWKRRRKKIDRQLPGQGGTTGCRNRYYRSAVLPP